MNEKPYFTKKLLCTAPDGTYRSFGGSKIVSAYSDRIEIGKENIPYARILEIKTLGNVLHIIYADPSGKRLEKYFRYDTFLSGKAVKELRAFRETAAQYLSKPAAVADLQQGAAPTALRCERLGDKNGREQVVVYSASVGFPPYCPVCLNSVASVTRLNVSSSFEAGGFWLIPVCRNHGSLKSSIKVHGWKAKSSEVTFSFSMPEYARRFYQLNTDPGTNPWTNTVESCETIHNIQTGTRFVIYQFVLSLIRISFLRTSGVYAVHSKGQAMLKGLPFVLFNLLFGWWSIHGLIWTPMAIYRNLRGGIDITHDAEAATRGKPISASRV